MSPKMRKKYLLIFCCLILAVNAFSQEDDDKIIIEPKIETKIKSESKTDSVFWDLSIFVSPDYNYRFFSGNDTNNLSGEYYNSIEIPRIGYCLGFSVGVNISKAVTFQFGVLYQNSGYKTKTLVDSIKDQYNRFMYTVDYHKDLRYHSLNIPLLFKFNLFKVGGTEFKLGLGVSPTLFMGKNTLRVYSDYKTPEISEAERNIDIQGLFCLNVLIPIGNNFFIGIEPTMRYNILGFNTKMKDATIKRNLYSPGLGITLTYRLFSEKMYGYYNKKIYDK